MVHPDCTFRSRLTRLFWENSQHLKSEIVAMGAARLRRKRWERNGSRCYCFFGAVHRLSGSSLRVDATFLPSLRYPDLQFLGVSGSSESFIFLD